MGTNPARGPGTGLTPPASVRSAEDIAAGLRAMENSALIPDLEESLNHELIIGRLLGPGVGNLIKDLQAEGKLPPFGSLEWQGFIELAEMGQVSIAPVILIGPKAYCCDEVVYERIRHGPPRPPDEGEEEKPGPARPAAPRPAAPARPKAPASLASEIASWG